ncbi:MAG: hypothetical protein HFF84_00480 [Oscillibacter sp.]|nr:hypothetical protein [Oscillibacter sp.]
MRRWIAAAVLLLALLCAGCGAEQAQEPVQELPEEPSFREGESVLLSLEAPLSDGRTLTLEAVGKELDEYMAGVREVRVYHGEMLLQTVSAREGIEKEWGEGGAEEFYDYTECWSPEETMTVLDLNFDGSTDFGLFSGPANNTIPYYYWTWDAETEQYRFACILQGAEVHSETKEVSAFHKGGFGGANYQTDYYQLDEEGILYLVRQERTIYGFAPNEDSDGGGTVETWVPREGVVIRPRPDDLWEEPDLTLIRRTVPLYEVDAQNRISYFLETWEPVDGELQLVSREPYSHEN